VNYQVHQQCLQFSQIQLYIFTQHCHLLISHTYLITQKIANQCKVLLMVPNYWSSSCGLSLNGCCCFHKWPPWRRLTHGKHVSWDVPGSSPGKHRQVWVVPPPQTQPLILNILAFFYAETHPKQSQHDVSLQMYYCASSVSLDARMNFQSKVMKWQWSVRATKEIQCQVVLRM